jgi:hypothetical protein
MLGLTQLEDFSQAETNPGFGNLSWEIRAFHLGLV